TRPNPEHIPMPTIRSQGILVAIHPRGKDSHSLSYQHHLRLDAYIPVDVVLEDKRGVEVGLYNVFEEIQVSEPGDGRAMFGIDVFAEVGECVDYVVVDGWLWWDGYGQAGEVCGRSEAAGPPGGMCREGED